MVDLILPSSIISKSGISGNLASEIGGNSTQTTFPLESIDNTAEKRRRNRRIDVRFSMKTPVIGDFEDILGDLNAVPD